jgi:hypothetical protein
MLQRHAKSVIASILHGRCRCLLRRAAADLLLAGAVLVPPALAALVQPAGISAVLPG